MPVAWPGTIPTVPAGALQLRIDRQADPLR
jgi:hypothetical protein